MNAEQGAFYDTAQGVQRNRGRPYTAYIRLPKLFELRQNLRASLSSGCPSGSSRS